MADQNIVDEEIERVARYVAGQIDRVIVALLDDFGFKNIMEAKNQGYEIIIESQGLDRKVVKIAKTVRRVEMKIDIKQS